jgi:ABC-type uncharacterized transport system substrate-binding protein
MDQSSAKLRRRLAAAAVLGAVCPPWSPARSVDAVGWGARGLGPSARPRVVVYLGSEPEASDGGLRALKAALGRNPRGSGRALKFRHAHIPVAEEPAMRSAIAQALAAPFDLAIAPTGDTARLAIPLAGHRPVVFSTYLDPVYAGFAQSMRHAAPNATGVAIGELTAKSIELLRDAFPRVRRVAILTDTTAGDATRLRHALIEPALAVGAVPVLHVVDSVAAVDALMTSPAARAVDGWYLPPTWISWLAERQLIAHLQRLQLPAIHGTVGEVERGALMAYALDTRFVWDTLAELSLRVLNGEPAGTIPIQRPRRFLLAVRPRDEPAWLRIHPAVVKRADRVF